MTARLATHRGHRGARHSVAARLGSFVSELVCGRPGTRRGDHGATATEYALMVSMIAVVIIVCVAAFGHNVSTLFNVPSSALVP